MSSANVHDKRRNKDYNFFEEDNVNTRKIHKVKRDSNKERIKEKLKKSFNDEYLTLDDTLSFGKHRGHTIREIINSDPYYLEWAIENKVIKLDKEAMRTLQDSLFKIREERARREQETKARARAQSEREQARREQWSERDPFGDFGDFDFRNFFGGRGRAYQSNTRQNTTIDKSKLLPAFRYDDLSMLVKSGKLLRLTGKIDKETIRSQYRKLVLVFHPDKCGQMDEVFQEVARTMFEEIKKAYDYLKEIYSL